MNPQQYQNQLPPLPQNGQNGVPGMMPPGQPMAPQPAAMQPLQARAQPMDMSQTPATPFVAQQVPQGEYAPPQATAPAMAQPNSGQAPFVAPFMQQQVAPAGMAPLPQAAPAPVVGQGGNSVVPVAPRSNPNSTQNSLQIAEIRDGIVIMNDGSYRSVVMVKSINFDLMSPQEQEAVEYSYQGFLNSLYFPIQIFLRSQKVDLQPYIAKLDKIRTEHDNMLLALLMEDYIDYIGNLSLQTNIMDKKFYVVIPFFPTIEVKQALTQSKNFLSGIAEMFSSKEQHVTVNEADLEAAKTELRNRVQSVLQGLLQCGIQGLPLDTQELIELYYDTYNPDTATRQELKNFDNLTADIITKGQGNAPQPHLKREMQ